MDSPLHPLHDAEKEADILKGPFCVFPQRW